MSRSNESWSPRTAGICCVAAPSRTGEGRNSRDAATRNLRPRQRRDSLAVRPRTAHRPADEAIPLPRLRQRTPRRNVDRNHSRFARRRHTGSSHSARDERGTWSRDLGGAASIRFVHEPRIRHRKSTFSTPVDTVRRTEPAATAGCQTKAKTSKSWSWSSTRHSTWSPTEKSSTEDRHSSSMGGHVRGTLSWIGHCPHSVFGDSPVTARGHPP